MHVLIVKVSKHVSCDAVHVSCDAMHVSCDALTIELRSIFSKLNLILQLFDSYLHFICLEEIEDFGKDAWIWAKPPGLEWFLTIMSILQDRGFAHKARTTKELLLLIKLSATFSGVQTEKHADPRAQQDSPLGQYVQQERLGEVQHIESSFGKHVQSEPLVEDV